MVRRMLTGTLAVGSRSSLKFWRVYFENAFNENCPHSRNWKFINRYVERQRIEKPLRSPDLWW